LIRAFGLSDDDDSVRRRRGPADPRISFGTGLVATALLGLLLTGLVAGGAAVIYETVGASSSTIVLVVVAACSGSLGALWRPLLGMFRAQRRPAVHGAMTILRASTVAAGAIAGAAISDGSPGATLIGAAAGGLAATAAALILAWGHITLTLDRHELRWIHKRSMRLAPVAASFWTIQNVDIYIVAGLASPTQVGLYRLASRLGSVGAHATSAVMSAWGPLQRSSEFGTANTVHGRETMRSAFAFYFLLFGIFVSLVGTLVAEQLIALVPADYSGANSLVPPLVVSFTAHGVLSAIYRSSTFPGRFRRYRRSVITAAVAFPPLCVASVAAFGAVGAPIATIVVLGGVGVAIVAFGNRGDKPLAVPWRRVLFAAAAAVATYLVAETFPSNASAPIAIAVTAGAIALAIPATHRRLLAGITRSWWATLRADRRRRGPSDPRTGSRTPPSDADPAR
jgi:O-antigen/teichoic acid export membrane protein